MESLLLELGGILIIFGRMYTKRNTGETRKKTGWKYEIGGIGENVVGGHENAY